MTVGDLKDILKLLDDDLTLLYKGQTYSDNFGRIGSVYNDDEYLVFEEDTD